MEILYTALFIIAIVTILGFYIAVFHEIKRDNKEDKRNITNQ